MRCLSLAPAPQQIDRRALLRFGAAGLGTLPLAWLSRSVAGRSLASPGFGKAKSVLVVFASGGQSQLDTWDPKPHAPEEIRGVFGTIPTAVPGLRFCEHLPRVARLADRLTVLRCVAHDDLDHGSAAYLSLTGVPHPRKSSNPPPQPTDYPTLGAVVSRVRPPGRLPHAAVTVNGPLLVPEVVGPGQNAGFLGRSFEPLRIGNAAEAPLTDVGSGGPSDLDAERLRDRRELLHALDPAAADDPAARTFDVSREKAYALLASSAGRRAFDLSQEPRALRERYGLHRSGQACLMGRRLVEAGVPWVTVFFNHSIRGQDKHPDATDWYGWDTHNDIFESLKIHLLPRFDQTFATLLEDMETRGLLKTTLVVCMGEFGRAPRVALEPRFAGATPGRKHWAAVYSIVLAGAGIGRGGVVGSSDRIGAYPAGAAYGPWDVAATLFAALGIDPATHYTDAAGRPYPVSTGKPIAAVYG
jgi:uncharacterized protein (DUF1501 family)